MKKTNISILQILRYITKNVLSSSFSKQVEVETDNTIIQVAQNVIRVSEGLSLNPIDLSKMIGFAEEELKKDCNKYIVESLRSINWDIFELLPEMCCNYVLDLIELNANIPDRVLYYKAALSKIIEDNK